MYPFADNDKYMRYRDEVATLIHEAFPFATVRFNAAKGAPPSPPPPQTLTPKSSTLNPKP